MVRYFIYKFVWWIKKEPFVDVVDIFDVVVGSANRWLVLYSEPQTKCFERFIHVKHCFKVFSVRLIQCAWVCLSTKKYKTIIKHFDRHQRNETWKLSGKYILWPLLKVGWIKGYKIEPKILYAFHCNATKCKSHKHYWYKEILIDWLLPKWIFFLGSTYI